MKMFAKFLNNNFFKFGAASSIGVAVNYLLQQKVANNEETQERFASPYPSDYIHGLLSLHTYQKKISEHISSQKHFLPLEFEDQANSNKYELILEDWKIKRIISEPASGFLAVTYYNNDDKNPQVVLAYRGTTFEYGDLFRKDCAIQADIEGILKGNIISQSNQAFEATREALDYANSIGAQLSITGHSLGGWLAEQSLYFCNVEFEGKSKNKYVKAVTFDSPGSKRTMEQTFKLNQHNAEKYRIDKVHNLDVVTYLSDPNIVNICNGHVGKIYRVFPKASSNGSKLKKLIDTVHEKLGGVPVIGNNIEQSKFLVNSIASISSHGLEVILDTFDVNTGKPMKYAKVKEWPVITFDQNSNSVFLDLLKNAVGCNTKKVFDLVDGVTLSSVLSILYDVCVKNISSEQFNKTWDFINKSGVLDIEEVKVPKGSYKSQDLYKHNKFSLKYDAHYETEEDNLYSDKINKKKYGVDYFLEKIKDKDYEPVISKYSPYSEFFRGIRDLSEAYEMKVRDKEIIIVNKKCTIDELREHAMFLFRRYPEEYSHLDSIIENKVKHNNFEERDKYEEQYKYKYRLAEIKKLLVDQRKSVDDIRKHFYNMLPNDKMKFFPKRDHVNQKRALNPDIDPGAIDREIINRELEPDIVKVIIEEGNKQILNHIKLYNSDEHIIVIGNTGAGKSTFVNYVTDADFAVEMIQEKVMHQGELETTYKAVLGISAEDKDYDNRPKMGKDKDSTTMIPNCYRDPKSNKIYWDCPGFDDTRGGGLQDIVNNFYIQELFSKLKNVKIVFISNSDDIKGHGKEFRAFIEKVEVLFKNDLKKLKDAAFIVRKTNNIQEEIESYRKEISTFKNVSGISSEQKKVLNIFETCKLEFFYPIINEKGETINSDKSGIDNTIRSLRSISEVAPGLAISDKAKSISRKLFGEFQDRCNEEINAFILNIKPYLEDNRIGIVSVINFCEWITSRTGHSEQEKFFAQLKDNLSKLGINDTSGELERTFNYLTFFSKANPTENKLNYNQILDFQALKSVVTKRVEDIRNEKHQDITNIVTKFFKEEFSNELENLKRRNDKHALEELKKYKSYIDHKSDILTKVLADKYPTIRGLEKKIEEFGKFISRYNLSKEDYIEVQIQYKNKIHETADFFVSSAISHLQTNEDERKKIIDQKQKYTDIIGHYGTSNVSGKYEFECKKEGPHIFKQHSVNLSAVQQQLDQCYEKYKAYFEQSEPRDVYIFGYNQVNFNASMNLRKYGNVAIVAPKWNLEDKLTLDLSGDSWPQPNSKANLPYGGSGKPGEPGKPGKNFVGVLDPDRVKGSLSNLTIDVGGGNGQSGQDGQNGEDGAQGYFRSKDNTDKDGKPQAGGNGGHGGVGGDPGEPGKVSLYKGYDSIKLPPHKDTGDHKGHRGEDGRKGLGGKGGEVWSINKATWGSWSSGENLYGEKGKDGIAGYNSIGKKNAAIFRKLEKADVREEYMKGPLTVEQYEAMDRFFEGINISGDHHNSNENQ